jgi:S1-C subfamily serine protease
MKYLVKILLFVLISHDITAQFHLDKNIEYTNFINVDSLKKYWELHPAEVDPIVGIYESFSSNEQLNSTLNYVLGIIKAGDTYKVILLGGQFGTKDIMVGGVKAVAQEMPNKGVYNLRWRMADARFIEKGFIFKEEEILTIHITKYPNTENHFIKTYSPTPNKKIISKGQWIGNGTGFFISIDGYIATNYHVISNASDIEIEFIRDGQKQNFTAKQIQIDKQNDLAILKVDDNSFLAFSKIPYNFKTQISEVGSNVFSLGYPMALSLMGTEIKFTDGKISSKTGFQGDITTYQISVPIQPGNSGGPLFDYDGNLIGITASGINRELDITENVNYAIKSSYLRSLVEVLPCQLKLPIDKSISSKTLTEKIKVLSDYVVLIKIK